MTNLLGNLASEPPPMSAATNDTGTVPQEAGADRLTVTKVHVYPRTAAALKIRLLTPKVGSTSAGWYFKLSGSLEGEDPGDPPVRIRVGSTKSLLDTLPVRRESGGGAYLFRGHINVFGLARQCQINVDAEFASGARRHFGFIDVDSQLPAIPPCPFSPLLLSALPRSGTTWLMSLLSNHPQIVTDRNYPYEVRQVIYWAHMIRVLSQPNNNPQEWREGRFLTNEQIVGGSPFFTEFLGRFVPWHGSVYPERLCQLVRDLAQDFYGRMQRTNGQATSGGFIAEKFPGIKAPLTMRWVFPSVREILLLRDPFSVMLSILRFNEKRGYKDFGEDVHGRTEALFKATALAIREMIDCFEKRCGDGSGILLRYEDLVADTPRGLSQITNLCGLDDDPGVIRDMIDRAQKGSNPEHITNRSGSAAATVLSPDEEAWVRDHFGDVLSRFYPDI